MRFIGDVHGKFGSYLAITDGCENSIQVGDYGVGFAPVPSLTSNHRFIRGNHDDPGRVGHFRNYIPDGHYEDGIFFLGGGESIDRIDRTESVDWWPDEQLSTGELYAMVDRYLELKPRILISHECPAIAVERLFGQHIRALAPSRTSQALSSMIEMQPPEAVIFGHFHIAKNITVNGIRFICLPELGFIDLDL